MATAAPGVPKESYAFRVEASLHDADTVYAVFNNKKMGDFSPYVYVSRNRGASWSSIAGDLPERGTAFSIRQDHVDPDLFFVGTEFSVFFTRDFERWIELGNGLPTIKVPDLELQRRENDVVIATFGRGFYVLDDYRALRTVSDELLARDDVEIVVNLTTPGAHASVALAAIEAWDSWAYSAGSSSRSLSASARVSPAGT